MFIFAQQPTASCFPGSRPHAPRCLPSSQRLESGHLVSVNRGGSICGGGGDGSGRGAQQQQQPHKKGRKNSSTLPAPYHTQTGTMQCQEETPWTERPPLTRVSVQPPQLFGHCLKPALALPSSKIGRPRHLEMDRTRTKVTVHRSVTGCE